MPISIFGQPTMVMTLKITRDKAPRPHYSDKKRLSVLKENQLGPYAPNKRKCQNCGMGQTDLRLCCGCREAWFCGKECKTKSWKAGHKQECVRMRRPLLHLTYTNNRESIEDKIDSAGYYRLGHEKKEVFVAVRDVVTGKLFDSLHDGELIGYVPHCE